MPALLLISSLISEFGIILFFAIKRRVNIHQIQ